MNYMSNPLLSLCIPTNGVSEWVFPVLDSIFSQNIDISLLEVVVTDNGNNTDFQKQMEVYSKRFSNLIYKKTSAFMFENQIEALRIANGNFLKFVNHRAVMESGAIKWMLDFIEQYKDEKPVIYFSNGALRLRDVYETNSFDGFVRGLREFASWTTGVGVWKTDFQSIPMDKVYNKISPHSDVLFAERKKNKYIIADRIWSHEIDSNHSKKGTYDLYKAFGIEEFSITLGLYLDGDITIETLNYVKKCYEKLLISFYRDFSIRRKPCSYDLNSFDDCVGVFFDKKRIKRKAWRSLLIAVCKKIISFWKEKNDKCCCTCL